MKKVQEIFKQHSDWLGIFGMCLIVFYILSGFFLNIISTSSSTTYVPFHDLRTIPITDVIYLDNDSSAYIEGIADGNRKIHIDVDDGKVPSNFKNTKNAVVYETSDKELYLNQKDYDEANPKVSKQDARRIRESLIGTMAILSIGFSVIVATVSTKNNQSAA